MAQIAASRLPKLTKRPFLRIYISRNPYKIVISLGATGSNGLSSANMSFKCILDVVVFLERFRNIDLYQQGLYCIRLSLASGSVIARPYEHTKGEVLNSSVLHSLIPRRICEGEPCFESGVFLIRYTEEEALLREQTTFRLEVDYPEEDFSLELTCMLLYSDLDGNLDPTTLPIRISIEENIPFKVVSTIHIHLDHPHLGLHEYLPITFDESRRCLVVSSIHCVLQTFLLRSEDENEEISREELAEKLVNVLFMDKKGQAKQFIGSDEMDKTYRLYVGMVARGHELLRSFLSSLIDHPLPPEDFHTPAPLLLPQQRSPKGAIVGKFSEAVCSHDPAQVCASLLSEISLVSADVYQMLNQLKQALRLFPTQVMRPLIDRHIDRVRSRFNRYIIKEKVRIMDQPITYRPTLESELQEMAANRRSINSPAPYPVELLPLMSDFPLIYEETYMPDYPDKMTAAPSPRSSSDEEGAEAIPAAPKEAVGSHKDVFVLVHGFQGRSYDVHLLKQAIGLANPDSLVLSSIANESRTEGDIAEMGLKLAIEVRAFIIDWCTVKKLGRLSFIGHSLGGLIIRAAIPHLTEYAGKMHLFMTFSTPHLGYISASSSRLIDAGMWLLKKWKKSAALQQLSLSDDPHIPSTALYNLSDCAGLRWFKYVVFCSSIQDQYVPHDSARVEIPEAVDPQRSRYLQEMAGKLLSQISLERFYRLDVSFEIKGRGIDALIGRTAHLQFLESAPFLEMLVQCYPEFFGSQ